EVDPAAGRAAALPEEPLEQLLGGGRVDGLPPARAAAPEMERAAARPAEPREPAAGLRPGVAELVVHLPLLRVGQDLVGLGQFLEFGLRLLVPGVLVRVVLLGELAVRLLDLVGGRAAADAQDFVVV